MHRASDSDLKTMQTMAAPPVKQKRRFDSTVFIDGYQKYRKAKLAQSAAKLGLNLQSIEDKRSV